MRSAPRVGEDSTSTTLLPASACSIAAATPAGSPPKMITCLSDTCVLQVCFNPRPRKAALLPARAGKRIFRLKAVKGMSRLRPDYVRLRACPRFPSQNEKSLLSESETASVSSGAPGWTLAAQKTKEPWGQVYKLNLAPRPIIYSKRGLCGQAHLKACHNHTMDEFLKRAANIHSCQCRFCT